MNPFVFLSGLTMFLILIFLITNVLYPVINRDVEYFWVLKTDWLKRNKKKGAKKSKRTSNSANP